MSADHRAGVAVATRAGFGVVIQHTPRGMGDAALLAEDAAVGETTASVRSDKATPSERLA